MLRAITAKLCALILIGAVFAAVLPTRAESLLPTKTDYCMRMAGDDNTCHSCMTDPNHPAKCCSTSPSAMVLFLSVSTASTAITFSQQLIVDLPAKFSLRFDRPPAPPPRSLVV